MEEQITKKQQEEIWLKPKESLVTFGGDPAWQCPRCGWIHVYGVEHPKAYCRCEKCGITLKYPWERIYSNDSKTV